MDIKELTKIINETVNIDCNDDIRFEMLSSRDIRLDDIYSGLRIKLIGYKEHLQVPLSIDITVGDPITPRKLEFKYKCMFDDSYINIMAFNLETIIAEKFETIDVPILTFSVSNETDNYLHLDLLKEKTKSCNDFEYNYIKNTDHFYNGKELEIENIILKWINTKF